MKENLTDLSIYVKAKRKQNKLTPTITVSKAKG